MIRRATATDVADIVRLAAQLDAAFEAPGFEARLKRILDHAAHAVFVAEGDDGTPRGFAAAEHRLLLSGERVEVTALVVDDGARRQGVGAQLSAAVEAWAARRGAGEVVARAHLVRDAAHGFYPALGYALRKTQHVYAKPLR